MIVKPTKKQKRAYYAQPQFKDDRIYRRMRWETVNKYGWFNKEPIPMVATLKKKEEK
jgi:hypothetical protein